MIMTPWGYSVAELPPILTLEQFRDGDGANLSSDDEVIEAKLAGVSAAVRDHCGWHVAPSLECEWTGDGEGALLCLPSMAVTFISSLSIAGVELDPDEYEWRSAGLVRLRHGVFPDMWRSVACSYVSGHTSASAISEVVSQIALNALVAAPGVAEEHAGGVGVTYNRTGDGVTGGVSLLARDIDALAPYVIKRAW